MPDVGCARAGWDEIGREGRGDTGQGEALRSVVRQGRCGAVCWVWYCDGVAWSIEGVVQCGTMWRAVVRCGMVWVGLARRGRV